MQAPGSHAEIREVNVRYHDVAATTYDSKWGIDFGATGQAQVLGKVRKLLGDAIVSGAGAGPLNGAAEKAAGTAPFPTALEIGAGTGYFSLNLMQAGLIGELTCTDISSGMLATLAENAERLGLAGVGTVQTDAEHLPFADASFDLVLGHAILHHIPDLQRAFAEFARVLAPGGRILFAGEPSGVGDRIARVPKRAAVTLAPVWRRAVGAGAAPVHVAAPGSQEQHDHELERVVDIHAFSPARLQRLASSAGFKDVEVRGEELLANWFGWFNRGLEASARHDEIPGWWFRYAFHGYLALQRLDERALESRLPPAIFYNLLLTAVKP